MGGTFANAWQSWRDPPPTRPGNQLHSPGKQEGTVIIIITASIITSSKSLFLNTYYVPTLVFNSLHTSPH